MDSINFGSSCESRSSCSSSSTSGETAGPDDEDDDEDDEEAGRLLVTALDPEPDAAGRFILRDAAPLPPLCSSCQLSSACLMMQEKTRDQNN
jgi:hypothetical protein